MNIKSRGIKKIIAAAMAVTVALVPFYPVSAEETKTVDEIQDEQNALSEKQADLEAQIAQLEEDEQSELEYRDLILEKMENLQEQITTANEDIKTLNGNIKKLNKSLEKSEKEYAETIELFKERVKAIYSTGSVGTLEILLNAESLSDYAMKAELMKSVSEHDAELMDQINDFMSETEDERKELKKEKETVAELKKSLEKNGDELAQLEEENKEVLDSIAADKSAKEESLSRTYDEENALANMMEQAIAAMKENQPEPEPEPEPEEDKDDNGDSEDGDDSEDNGDSEDGDNGDDNDGGGSGGDSGQSSGMFFQWPCPGYSYISAGWEGYPGHKGLDMAAAYGTPIYAAASGTVMVANSTDEWGDSWGYYVSIYHNDTYSTLYAHCSSLTVSEGQYVEQGQLIGYVGLTGNTTGYHLHFEVYEDGTRVDPAQFF